MKASDFEPREGIECKYCYMLFGINEIDEHEKNCPSKDMVIIINSKPLDQNHRLLYRRVWIAGIQYHEKNAFKMLKGKEHSLTLKYEPENEFDKNAIAVIGHCKKGKKDFAEKIGYVPAVIAADIVGKHSDKAIIAYLKIIYLPTKETKHRAAQRLLMFFDIYAHRL